MEKDNYEDYKGWSIEEIEDDIATAFLNANYMSILANQFWIREGKPEGRADQHWAMAKMAIESMAWIESDYIYRYLNNGLS